MRSVAKYAVAAFVLLALALLFQPASYAQINGTITGSVYDTTGAVIPGANVTLLNQASGDKRASVSNSDGHFAFGSVPPGTYTIKVEIKGFKTFLQPDLVLQASDTRNVAATLEVGQTIETVTVEAHTDLTPVDSGARSLDLTESDYSKLPMITRNAAELLRTLPGAITVGNGASNGSNSSMDFSGVGSAGSSVGNGVSEAGVPYRGGTALLMDGTNIIDEGCDCTSIAVPNPDMVQEVKVQTSAFGADSAKGPVVIDFITKSGSQQYHGEGYLYARNAIFNSDDWIDNNEGHSVATGDHYYYPGGNVGGPVPGLKKKLLFWAGYEHFYQLSTGGTNLTSYIPTPDMLGGNFGPTAANNALCQADFGVNAQSTVSKTAGTYCYDPSSGLGPGGTAVTATVPVDPGAAAMWKLMPPANANPAATPGGYNYFFPVPALHNGYVFRGRGDYNFDENNKLFVTYQYSKDNEPSDGDSHMWWLPGNSVVFPGGGLMNPTTTKNVTGNFLHVFSPSLTNSMTAFWTYYWSPQAPVNYSAVLRGTVGYPTSYGTQFPKTNPNLNDNQVPSWNSAGNYTFPDFSQEDVFSQSGGVYFIKKENPAFSDDLTKVFKAHTFKMGFYYETTGNNQGNFAAYNGIFSFGSSSTPYPDAVTGLKEGTQNPTANFMMGLASGYNEQNSLPLVDLAYKTFSVYGMDSWKMTKRFTFDYGVRLDHIGHWYDRDGFGLAVWNPQSLVSDVDAGLTYPGVRWHGRDPGLQLSGDPNRFLHFEPRVGVAYDVFGTGKTVVRGGWGIYMFNDQVNDPTGAADVGEQSFGTSLPSNTNVLLSEPGLLPKPATYFTPNQGGFFAQSASDYGIPWVQTWNLTIDQRTPWNTHLDIAYEGNSSGDLNFGGQTGGGGSLGGGDLINVNRVPMGAFFGCDPILQAQGKGCTIAPNPENVSNLQDYHPYGEVLTGPNTYTNVYGTNSISVEEHKGYSTYNALEAIWSKQTGRLSYNFSGLWSKSLGFGNGNVNPFVLRDNYMVLNIDRPFVFSASYSYDLGKAYHGDNKVLGGAANGWTIAGFTTWQKGGDIQAQVSANFGLGLNYSYLDPVTGKTVTTQLSQRSYFGTDAGINIQPTETCNPNSGLASKQYANLSCFALPSLPSGAIAIPDLGVVGSTYAIQSNGPYQLPYESMPAFFDSDLTIHKSFHITERHQIEFRVTATNFLNHALPGFANSSPLSLTYSVNPANKTYSYTGTTPAAQWGFTNQKNEPNSAGYGRVLQFGLKYSF
jgi:hypothetical protein